MHPRFAKPLPIAALALIAAAFPALAAPDAPHFSREILPILSDHCFQCHGPDEKHRKAGLRLDTEAGAKALLDGGGAAVVPGKSADSSLMHRILTGDEGDLMPPPEINRPLSAAQIALLRRWIDAGAPWGNHWAFERLEEPPVPDPPAFPHWQRTPLDAFIARRLAAESLAPQPPAPRHALLRRLSLDLRGLPPSPEEADAFAADGSPDADIRLADRLLASPRFGERLAWDWLDAARYADSNGYQGDGERTMWPWRDWVADAFNRNMPFDQFTLWQLAGDLLPGATDEQRLATGFNRNHMINGEGGRIPAENRVDYVMDMAETYGTVWLGLTLNCCRCHNHKFDPLTEAEYYQFFAFFNQTPVDGSGGDPQTAPNLAVITPALEKRIAEAEAKLRDLDAQIKAGEQRLAENRGAWEAEKVAALAGGDGGWRALRPAEMKAVHQELTTLEDGSVLAAGPNPKNDTYTLTFTLNEPAEIGALLLEALRHESMTKGGIARSDSGNFVLTGIEIELRGEGGAQRAAIASAEATFEQGDLKVEKAYDGNPGTGWAVYDGKPIDRDHAAVFRFAEPLAAKPGDRLAVTLRHDSPHASHNLGRFRLSASADKSAKLPSADHALLAALQTPPAERNGAQRKQIADAHAAGDAALTALKSEREKAQKSLEDARKAAPKVMVMADMEKPRQTFILDKGLYDQPRDEVAAGVPASLPPMPEGAPDNRLGLAQWTVADENPLAARVAVNRFWQSLFGIGLVKTPEDFGLQGERPVHPELLDWLASNFASHGWDVKRLHRTVALSAAYQQAAKSSPDLAERDPDNRLFARGARYRMPFWMLRDQALAASGLLVDQIGGAPVNPYQPEGVWEEATFGNKKYRRDQGESLYRRSLYTFWRRIIAPTMFFDNATRQTCTIKINRTNTPLQALATLNGETYAEAARALAQSALLAESDPARRAAFLYRRVLARHPSDAESKVLTGAAARYAAHFESDPEAANAFLAQGESPRDPSIPIHEHAAWSAVAMTVLNLDEAVTRE